MASAPPRPASPLPSAKVTANQLDVDAEAARHALVVDGGPHGGAEARVLERQHQQQRHRQSDADQEQPIAPNVTPRKSMEPRR